MLPATHCLYGAQMFVLFTDFGLSGPYTGQMKAVLAREAPGVPIIDLFADAPACDPLLSAYLLAAYAGAFPSGCCFICVVDPGVGTSRRPLVVEADGRFFIGPDNGLFEPLLRRASKIRLYQIDWQPDHLSASFHGRDLFAPVAARLMTGQAVEWTELAHPVVARPDWPDDLARVVYIDVYGNAMTGIRAAGIGEDAVISVGSQRIRHARTFGAVPAGQAFWYGNSNGLVEIAVNRGRADRDVQLASGQHIEIIAG